MRMNLSYVLDDPCWYTPHGAWWLCIECEEVFWSGNLEPFSGYCKWSKDASSACAESKPSLS